MSKSLSFGCSICCTLLIAGLIIGFGIKFLVEAKDFILSPYYIWIWNVITICINFVSLCDFIIMAYINLKVEVELSSETASKLVSPVRTVIGIIDFGMFFWGSYIHYNVINQYIAYPVNLWIFFQVMFIALCVSVAIYAFVIVIVILASTGVINYKVKNNITVKV